MNGQWSPTALVTEFIGIGSYFNPDFSFLDLEYPASYRGFDNPLYTIPDAGFRITLYLND